MKCKNCNKELAEGTAFCPECGTSIVTDNNASNEQEKTKRNNLITSFWEKADLFTKVIICLFIMIFLIFIISAIAQNRFAIFLSICEFIGLIISLLIAKDIIKTPQKWISYVTVGVGVLLIPLILISFSWKNSNNTNQTNRSSTPIANKSTTISTTVTNKKNETTISLTTTIVTTEKTTEATTTIVTKENDNEASVPDENYSFYYSDYQDVQKKLSSAGFTNIKTKPLYDIYWGITPEGSVEDVKIDGKTSYKKGDKFNKDVEIVITYHLKIEDDPDYNSSSSPVDTNKSSDVKEDSSLTQGQKNALKSAKSYISIMDFSRDGLIEQLEYEKYTYDQAVYGANNCGANWNEEAAESARSYISWMEFSREELIDQLLYEGFTYDQAEYGVQAVGY